MYALGAPALAVVLTEGASLCTMPAAAAAKILATALAAIGFVSDDAFTYIASNETDESIRSKKGLLKRINEGLIIEVKPLKAAIIGVAVLMLVIGTSHYLFNNDIFGFKAGDTASGEVLYPGFAELSVLDADLDAESDSSYSVKSATISILGNNNGFFMTRDNLPAEIANETAFYGMSFWMRNLKNVTPEVALVRNYLAESDACIGSDFYPMDDEIWVDWFPRETNIICFYDSNHKLLAYVYGYYGSNNATTTELKYVYNFNIDVQKTREAAWKNVDSFFDMAQELPEEYFYKFVNEARPEYYSIDLDFEAAGVERSDAAYYSNILSEATDRDINTAYLKAMLAKYWNGEDRYFNEDIYDRRSGYALGYELFGSTAHFGMEYLTNCFFLFDRDGNPTYYSFLTLSELRTLDKRMSVG